MSDAGFFRGTSADQDNRFSDKEKKLLKQMRFADNLMTKIEMNKIKLDVIKPWISSRIAELLGMDDDVIVEFVINQLEAEKNPDARKIQINLTGFLNGKNARIFTGELWGMLISAQESSTGIPTAMIEAKKDEIKKRNDEQERIHETIRKNVSRFDDKLIKEERQSPPPTGTTRRDKSPEGSSRDKARSKSKERDSNSKSNRFAKPSEPDKRKIPTESDSKGHEDASQNKRNYRGRRSSSASPENNHKKRSRSRSGSRERKSDKDRRERDHRVSLADRDRGRDHRDKGRRSRSPRVHRRSRSRSPPPQRRGGRSRSRSPYRGNRRSASPKNTRRRSPFQDSRGRPELSHRDIPARRQSSSDRHRKIDEKRSKSRTPPPLRSDGESKISGANNSLNKTSKWNNNTLEPLVIRPLNVKPTLTKNKSNSSSDGSSSSSPDNNTEKSNKKRKASASTSNSSESEEDQHMKKKKERKKKKEKKHRKHKKHKKIKKSKQKTSNEEENESEVEGTTTEKMGPATIAKSYLKLVEPHNPPPEDLERKLREKALESMKKVASSSR